MKQQYITQRGVALTAKSSIQEQSSALLATCQVVSKTFAGDSVKVFCFLMAFTEQDRKGHFYLSRGISGMETAIVLEYLWVLIILIGLEGILAADNALVMAIMVKHLPEKQRRKALFYGLAGAVILRFAALFIISFLVNIWQIQAIGAAYLLFLSINHLVQTYLAHRANGKEKEFKPKKQSGFWMTVLKVEIADIAFAIDSILAAFALAIALPETSLPAIGGMDGAQFLVIFFGGLIGVIIMRFAATLFVQLLHKRPALETAAFAIVGWVGVKLVLITLAHPALAVIPEHVPQSTEWKAIFWGVLAFIAVCGFLVKPKQDETISS